jgi:RHS repeat-associated protein
VNNYLFTGEQYDPDLGLYYLRARYHNTDTGRFWTQDSFEGGGTDPSSLHKYTYCGNNPVNAFDPSGNVPTLTELGVSAEIAAGITWGVISGATSAYATYRHNGNQWGWNMLTNGLVGFGTGFAFGYFLGPLPPEAWQTTSARWLMIILSSWGINQAFGELQDGYPDLAFVDTAFALLPLKTQIVRSPRSGGAQIFDAGASPNASVIKVGAAIANEGLIVEYPPAGITAPFETGEIIVKEFPTSKGVLEMAAEVAIEGTTLHLKDIAVYPRNADSFKLGTREMISLRNQLAAAAKSMGFTKLRITGTRFSGANPGKNPDVTVDLK